MFRSLMLQLAILFFPILLLAEKELTSSPQRIDIVYHIATLNNWEEIVREQIQLLNKCGLSSTCDSITVTVVGSEYKKAEQLVQNLFPFDEKLKIIHACAVLDCYEFPAIEMVQTIALQEPTTKILYMHTKGVKSPSNENVRLWRKYMEYFNIEKWQDCVAALEDVDICGVDLAHILGRSCYFSGNFWWGRAGYIQTCHLRYTSQYDCEEFIGTGHQPIAKSFHQTGQNPLLACYTPKTFPQYYHGTGAEQRIEILNLYAFSYLDEYYRK